MREAPQDREPALPHPADSRVRPANSRVRYTSFVLRCWTGEDGQVHARLIDLRTGVGHVVGKLALLPDLVRRLVTNPPSAGAEPQARDSRGLDQIDLDDRR